MDFGKSIINALFTPANEFWARQRELKRIKDLQEPIQYNPEMENKSWFERAFLSPARDQVAYNRYTRQPFMHATGRTNPAVKSLLTTLLGE